MRKKYTKDLAAVQACYSSWSKSYYRDYYGSKAAYPPVHVKILKGLLRACGARNVLDAGCGSASFLRTLLSTKIQLYGFDLTREMTEEARRVLGMKGIGGKRIWEGNVLEEKAFCFRERGRKKKFDAALCVGVLPHIPRLEEERVFRNLRTAVKKNGLVAVEARNQLFALGTMNRYSYDFFSERLIDFKGLKGRAGSDAGKIEKIEKDMKKFFRTDLPPCRKGKKGEPGYDEILSHTHNPLVLRQQFERAGFRDVKLLFYHYHVLPPMYERLLPEFFSKESRAMEKPEDWRGHFMASAFILCGKKK